MKLRPQILLLIFIGFSFKKAVGCKRGTLRHNEVSVSEGSTVKYKPEATTTRAPAPTTPSYNGYTDNTKMNESGICLEASGPISQNKHEYAENGLVVQRIAFSSCYMPETVKGTKFWGDVRSYNPDLWLWLGDNMYADTHDMNEKRQAYNNARDEPSYVSHGPVKADAKIPVMATWDDHDCCKNNMGVNYECLPESQNEFASHFNLDQQDPRHKDHPGGQQRGVYNSRIFKQPGTVKPGIQVIMLDTRSGRDPTYEKYGKCKGTSTKMLSDEQWTWLEQQLNVKSEIKLIGSGVQVLPPTNMERAHHDFCSYDTNDKGVDQNIEYEDFFLSFYDITRFRSAIEAVGEGDIFWEGTEYEAWAEIPMEREKLLGMAQRAINNKKAKVVVFVSGDQHWAELMAKRMPDSEKYGKSQVLYEVTASGIMQNWLLPSHNSNRLRFRSADHGGEGPFNKHCQFPFRYNGVQYDDCTTVDNHGTLWCSLLTDPFFNHMKGFWGNCAPLEEELAQRTFTNSTHTCSASKFEICSAAGNYGTIDVDFSRRKLKMRIKTPIENEEMWHEISY